MAATLSGRPAGEKMACEFDQSRTRQNCHKHYVTKPSQFHLPVRFFSFCMRKVSQRNRPVRSRRICAGKP
ncbi:conserved hypothetical protein [Ricinus communis]|uniref:Uncharacterized protein n=1 Tax=Ricinus communis TaxID=3988 RepID=B9TPE8_RICCO|nr:conserved hypothetical protein [Ricinus communis]